MPIALRQSSQERSEQPMEVGLTPMLHRLDMSIFEEISHHLDKIDVCQREEREFERKRDKLAKFIEAAKETIAKGEKKRDELLDRKRLLQERVEAKQERVREALDYWKNYGLDIRQISKEGDDFEHYEFIYSRLPAHVKPKQPDSQTESSQSQQAADNTDKRCTIGIKFQDDKLLVVSQSPEIMSEAQLEELNGRLTKNCLGTNKLVDYRLAMLMIKKVLVRNPSPPASSSSAAPAAAAAIADPPS